MKFSIDKKRQSIIDCTGNLLVIGGPGSGKTTIALVKAFNFLRSTKLNRGQKILFLSFSRNAKARILESSQNFPEAKQYGKSLYVQTYHAFFLELIKTYGYLLGLPKTITVLAPHDESALRGNRLQKDQQFVQEKKQIMFKEGKIPFDEFSKIVLDLVTRSKRIRKLISSTYPMIIVDEAQDTDFKQWEFIKTFNGYVQLFLLADLDQQIFDYRPEVNPERVAEIKNELIPLEVSLQSENFRSPNTEIIQFAKDVLYDTPRNGKYKGVSILYYSPQITNRDKHIMQALGRLNQTIKDQTGKNPRNIAILCSWAKGVNLISSVLRKKNIEHRVQFDTNATYLSSRLIACLLEPIMDEKQHLLFALHILKDFYSSKGSTGEITKYIGWIDKVRNDKKVGGKVIPYLRQVISEVKKTTFTGNPANDWRLIQQKLVTSSVSSIQRFARHSEYLIAFNRGRIIMRDLTKTWVENGCYIKAREILQNAIVESQLSTSATSEKGIHVMTTYKSKGKEFDGVIIFQNNHNSPIDLREDNKQTLIRSRKLLLVGATRARHHVFILKQYGSNCNLLNGFQ